jgi:phosphoribosyl-AMP cyclohydrolase / phosphoribosyl-ATP pyrophosphohydrolase
MSPNPQRPGDLCLQPGDIAGLDFDKGDGLLPAVIQHAEGGSVLMVGYMNREALHETFARGRVVFFSRSKGRLWEKGETSGHFLDVVEIRTDCDRDALLVRARPRGPTCHLGTATCFGDEPARQSPSVRASEAQPFAFLSELEGVIERRVAERPEGSYTARLFSQGPKRIAQKVGEEGLEVALAAVAETDEKVLSESADLLYHLLVLLKSRGLPLEKVVAELQSRHAGKP